MPFTITVQHEIQFSETDMAGIVHFSNFFKWMEKAENAFFQEIGFPLVTSEVNKTTGWPKVNVACTFKRPLKFGNSVEIQLIIHELRNHSILYGFTFHKIINDFEKEEIAKGQMTTVYAQINQVDGNLSPKFIDEALKKKINDVNKIELNPAINY